MSDEAAQKREAVEFCVAEDMEFNLHVKTYVRGLVLPASVFKTQSKKLRIVPYAKDAQLVVNSWGVTVTLTFRNTLFRVKIPWKAIYHVETSNFSWSFAVPDRSPFTIIYGGKK